MAVSDKPWGQFSASDYTPEQFCRAALVDENPSGEPKRKENCHLPVMEPDGTVNRNGMMAAAAALAGARGGLKVSLPLRQQAARALLRMYRMHQMEPPDSLLRLAGG